MKLPESNLTTDEELREFDVWLTPSLQEIQDTQKYREELDKVCSIIDALGPTTNYFEDSSHCQPKVIAKTCINVIEEKINTLVDTASKISLSIDFIESLASLLFLVTGKSDNNLKCQYPVFLFQQLNRTVFPHMRYIEGKPSFANKKLGRTLKSDKVAKLISNALVCSIENDTLNDLEDEAKWLLCSYISAILKDDKSITQFWALGKSYFNLSKTNPEHAKSLLAPIIIFKVRGSVSASGGHIPENILRDVFSMWGLDRGIDYNLDDVILSDNGDKSKTRAYDFILPYKTPNWEPSIFIQCQFYAGDSGSVSHKVVDQTTASRNSTLVQFPNARFIEYLDGAGYYSSLNTDLQHMLNMETTKSFIQVRSLSVRLRRELQEIGFITPIEIEHAIMRSGSQTQDEITKCLIAEGYSNNVITQGLSYCLNKKFVILTNNKLKISKSRLAHARRILLLDIIALIGTRINEQGDQSGNILIPGYGPFYGAQLRDISKRIDEYAPNINYDRNSFSDDINWLSERKCIILR